MSDPLGLFSDTNSNDPLGLDPLGLFAKQAKSVKDQTLDEVQQALNQQNAGLTATGETALSLGTGLVGAGLGWVPAAMQKLNGAPDSFENLYAKNMEAMTFQPRTEAGQEMTGRVGEVINRYVVPVAPILGSLPAVKMAEGANAMKARFAPKEFGPEVPKAVTPKTGVAAMKEELAGKTEPTAPAFSSHAPKIK